MIFSVAKVLLAAAIITFASWLAGRRPELAGFITALPLVSIIAIGFAYWHHQDMAQTTTYAKSIFVAIPLSVTFFLPFLVAEKFNLNFWVCFIGGFALLAISYFIHQKIMAGSA